MKKNPTGKIKVLKDGPLLVTGGLPLDREVMVCGADKEPERWVIKEVIPTGETYSLCRCGLSKNKPFCDGSHVAAGFDGTETAARKPYLEIAEKTIGPGVDLTDGACFCAIARFCHRGGDTWTQAEQSGDPEMKRLAIETAGSCPSGRLVAWDKKTGEPIEPEFEPSVSVTEDTRHMAGGPLWVKGGVPVESADGQVYEVRNRVTLCRCGLSKNKPFCDGTHVKERFDDGDESIRKL